MKYFDKNKEEIKIGDSVLFNIPKTTGIAQSYTNVKGTILKFGEIADGFKFEGRTYSWYAEIKVDHTVYGFGRILKAVSELIKTN